MFSETFKYWAKRKKQFGDRAVGNVAEDRGRQGTLIGAELLKILGTDFYTHGLDFGCGYGRLTPYLDRHCGHLWVVDIFDDWSRRAGEGHQTVTSVKLDSYVLPFDDGAFDLVVDIMTVQSIDEKDRVTVMEELSRVLAPGGKLVSLMKVEHIDEKLNINRLFGVPHAEHIALKHIDKKQEPYCLIVGTKSD